MGMSRARKESEIVELRNRIDSSGVVVVVHYSGLTVAKMTELRSNLLKEGGSFKVTKNTLASLAIKGTQYEGIGKYFTGPTGIATSDDPVIAARVVNDFAKENEKLVIIGGGMGEKVLSKEDVVQLASLPSLDELRSKLVGLLVAPATKIARITQTPAQMMVGVTKAYGEKQG